jgi:nitrogen-specific signal transduction histidine kinase
LNWIFVKPGDAVPLDTTTRCACGLGRQSPTAGEGHFAQISITDNGEGFDDEAKDKIFTPYWTSKPTGTGLGLPIVEHIVRDYGGNIPPPKAHLPSATTDTIQPTLPIPSSLPSKPR